MEWKNIELKTEANGVWVLTMNRPQALNALNLETISELDQALNYLMDKSPMEARAMIITGSGEKAFVAGADIKEMLDFTSDKAQLFAERGQKVFQKIEQLRMPVIAAVNGFALGGGLELALSCDFIYASENAKFGLPEVSLGLIPGFGGCVRLSRVVGLNKARELTMTGDMLSATEALQFGLIQKISPKAELLEQVFKTITTILSRGPFAIASAKSTILEAHDLEIDGGLALEAKSFGRIFATKDSREGINAFIEKRIANFQGN